MRSRMPTDHRQPLPPVIRIIPTTLKRAVLLVTTPQSEQALVIVHCCPSRGYVILKYAGCLSSATSCVLANGIVMLSVSREPGVLQQKQMVSCLKAIQE